MSHNKCRNNLLRLITTTVFSLAVLATEATSQSFTVLHSFQGADGSQPVAKLFRVGLATVYGTTSQGGTGQCIAGCGVVFKITSRGKYTVLHDFAGGSDGAAPQAGVIRDGNGNLYGTTSSGGDANCGNGFGCGMVFKLDSLRNETVLHRFAGGSDGANPVGDLVRDKDGNLYGTTFAGGTANGGTIFTIDSASTETVLHSFTGNEGYNPAAGLVRDNKGNLYGTTWQGSTIFRLDAAGHITVLHTFVGFDGIEPQGLTRDATGNLFGTTVQGGTGGYGVVYKLDPQGHYTVLHNFAGPDGVHPEGGVVLDLSGNLYGVTLNGGMGFGTIYKVDTNRNETVLYSFKGQTDGGLPRGGLVLNKYGTLFGTTTTFGGSGTVFQLVP